MTKAFTLKTPGDFSSLKLTDVELPNLKTNEIRVKNSTIGINRYDLHDVKNDYGDSNPNEVVGIEALGTIVEVASDVKDFKKGDKVVYASGLKGSYSEECVINAKYAMIVEKDFPEDVLVALYAKGLFAQCLARQVYFAQAKSTVVVLGAAGGIGYILCQTLKASGCKIIAVVGSEEKAAFVGKIGADLILNHNDPDLIKKIKAANLGLGANCVYDCYGKGFLAKTIQMTAPFGSIVNYGDVLGSIDNLDVLKLWKKSLYFVRPNLFLYKFSNRVEMVLSSVLLYDYIKSGRIKPKINSYKFKEIPKALKDIEQNKIIGSVVAQL
jgi:NADPH2:quinone reductase